MCDNFVKSFANDILDSISDERTEHEKLKLKLTTLEKNMNSQGFAFCQCGGFHYIGKNNSITFKCNKCTTTRLCGKCNYFLVYDICVEGYDECCWCEQCYETDSITCPHCSKQCSKELYEIGCPCLVYK